MWMEPHMICVRKEGDRGGVINSGGEERPRFDGRSPGHLPKAPAAHASHSSDLLSRQFPQFMLQILVQSLLVTHDCFSRIALAGWWDVVSCV